VSADLQIEAYNDELKHAVSCAGDFERKLAQGEPVWLSLLGNCGAGKTQIAMALYRRFKPQMAKKPDTGSASGWRETFQKKQKFTWPFIANKIMQRDYGIIDYVCDDIDFLVIDELGGGHDIKFTKSKLSEIAERRIGKPTIWTSNMSLEQISDELDMRIASRMIRHGSHAVVFEETEDWNLVQLQQQAG
jgi:DNA replication protein DnaC